jgi:small ligand-binding sensory domain FIST
MVCRLLSRLRAPEQATFLYFDCAGRGSALFGEPGPDVEVVSKALGEGRELGGFFCFGEISSSNKTPTYHNFSGVLVAIEP